MTHLDTLRTFCLAAQLGNFSACARQLALPRATVSLRISQLEQTIGVRLFKRSTRHIELTNEGQTLYQAVTAALNQIDNAIANMRQQDALTGSIRISVPSLMPDNALTLLLQQFCDQHPQVQIEIIADDAVSDFVRDNIDIAIRGRLVKDNQLVCRHWRAITTLLVANPDRAKQFAADSAILDPLQLLPTAPRAPQLISRDLLTCLQLCLSGKSAALLPQPLVAPYLEDHQLITLPQPDKPLTINLYLVYEAWPLLAPATRSLVQFLQQQHNHHEQNNAEP